ncbi:MAG: flagellar protein export ATPase FliI [bacterium]
MDLQKYFNCLMSLDPIRLNGRVTQVIGLIIEAQGPAVNLGELCYIFSKEESLTLQAEVVGFKEDRILLMPLGEIKGIGPGCEVVASGRSLSVKVGNNLLGKVLDALGNPLDGSPLDFLGKDYPVNNVPPNPLTRERIHEPLEVGVRAIDGILTCGKGQRVGIMAGSGVGKSTLLGMIARNTKADINVIALIGERGREVRDFIERDLGEEGLKRSVVIVATSDQPALLRVKGALVATAVAEYFRDLGKNVLLMMDSVTRFAMAQREIGLAVGEPPTTRGYTPSVFAILPKLLERSGTSDLGSITALYTVLVEGDDMTEPVTDAVRGILDGHIILSRQLASQNHYPAIDILGSVSRVMTEIVSPEHRKAASALRNVLASYREAEDLINIGAYEPCSNPKIDYAISKIADVNDFLMQDVYEKVDYDQTVKKLLSLLS